MTADERFTNPKRPYDIRRGGGKLISGVSASGRLIGLLQGLAGGLLVPPSDEQER
jgi:hypothetical protein